MTVAGYELWGTESGNPLDDFDTEAQALSGLGREADIRVLIQ